MSPNLALTDFENSKIYFFFIIHHNGTKDFQNRTKINRDMAKKRFLSPHNLSRPKLGHILLRGPKMPSKVWVTIIVDLWPIVNSIMFFQNKTRCPTPLIELVCENPLTPYKRSGFLVGGILSFFTVPIFCWMHACDTALSIKN